MGRGGKAASRTDGVMVTTFNSSLGVPNKETQVILWARPLLTTSLVQGSCTKGAPWNHFLVSHSHSSDGKTHTTLRNSTSTHVIADVRNRFTARALWFTREEALSCYILSLNHKLFCKKLYKFLNKQILLLCSVGPHV